MMWKERYRIGIETIDDQHKKLFLMTGELINAIEEKEEPEAFRKAICFLKEYVDVHFREEESYQASIHYAGMAEHVKQHRMFADAVQSYGERLEESGYDMEIVKELAGVVTAWLIYHVADVDQKIVGKNLEPDIDSSNFYIDYFGYSIKNVLMKMTGQNSLDIHMEKISLPQMADDVLITIDLIGELSGRVVYGFSKEFAIKLFEAMTFTLPNEVDSLVCSALMEITNIASGNVAVLLADKGMNCDIKPPVFIPGKYTEDIDMETIQITTKFGKLEIAFVEENCKARKCQNIDITPAFWTVEELNSLL